MEYDAVRLVQRPHEVAHPGAENSLHRPLLGRHHMHLDAAAAQRRRDFSPMKLAPSTTARRAAVARSMMA